MKREMHETAEHRSNSYGFLSIVYLQEPTKKFIKLLVESNILNLVSEPALQFEDQITNDVSNKFLNELVLEYTRLFIGPGKHVSPYESVYRDNEDALWSETTVEVKNFIEASGLAYSCNWHGLPDHIGVELEFMHRLTCHEREARAKGDQKAAIHCLEFEKRFIDEHLSQWVPAFCDKVKEESRVGFYGAMAEFTKQFIGFDSKLVDKNIKIMRS